MAEVGLYWTRLGESPSSWTDPGWEQYGDVFVIPEHEEQAYRSSKDHKVAVPGWVMVGESFDWVLVTVDGSWTFSRSAHAAVNNVSRVPLGGGNVGNPLILDHFTNGWTVVRTYSGDIGDEDLVYLVSVWRPGEAIPVRFNHRDDGIGVGEGHPRLTRTGKGVSSSSSQQSSARTSSGATYS